MRLGSAELCRLRGQGGGRHTSPGDHTARGRRGGIVSKRLGSRYRSGRSPDWLKFKNLEAHHHGNWTTRRSGMRPSAKNF